MIRVFVDYSYYVDDFGGTKLSEEEFNKYGNAGCMEITANTLSRVSDSTINGYPIELISRIKNCACTIAEYLKTFHDAFDAMAGSSGEIAQGIAKSKTAGAVSVTYDTAAAVSYLLDPVKQKNIIQSVLNIYLSPVCIGGVFYNLLSKVLDTHGICESCRII